MSATRELARPALAPPPLAPASGASAGTVVWSAHRTERRKLLSQLASRMLTLLCVLGPFAFTVILNSQTGSPSDTIFGVWVHSSGFAIPLVVLAFAGSWGFPVLAGVLAGDIFSAEDRYGTWKTVLTRSCRRWELFVGKGGIYLTQVGLGSASDGQGLPGLVRGAAGVVSGRGCLH